MIRRQGDHLIIQLLVWKQSFLSVIMIHAHHAVVVSGPHLAQWNYHVIA
jgi:hypothetical protein